MQSKKEDFRFPHKNRFVYWGPDFKTVTSLELLINAVTIESYIQQATKNSDTVLSLIKLSLLTKNSSARSADHPNGCAVYSIYTHCSFSYLSNLANPELREDTRPQNLCWLQVINWASYVWSWTSWKLGKSLFWNRTGYFYSTQQWLFLVKWLTLSDVPKNGTSQLATQGVGFLHNSDLSKPHVSCHNLMACCGLPGMSKTSSK